MSLGRLSIKTRLELETRVLAAALKMSLQSGDLAGARLAHEQLTKLMKSGQAIAPSNPPAAEAPIPVPDARQPEAVREAQVPAGQFGNDRQEPTQLEMTEPAVPAAQGAPVATAPPLPPQPMAPAPEPPTTVPTVEEIAAETVETADTEPPQPVPTAADALHRSIVNTPMRASANNIPVVRSIDPDVLLASSSSGNTGDMSQKLSESLAKIEAAMNSPQQMPAQSIASMLGGNGAHTQDEAGTSDEAKGAEHQYQGLYRLLGVSQMSPYEEIHKNFLVRVRAHIRQINVTKRPEKLELLHSLRRIWIAHDILTDPVTRTDYDFRDLGLRGDAELVMPPTIEDKQQAQQTNRTPTRIGELLQCAGLLEAAELQIACDMHKAMPEVQFGTFLIKQGFIGERDLESVLLGQKLLRAGIISVAQFQVAMELSQSRGHSISDTLVERGYVTEEGLAKAIEAIDAPPTVSSPPPPQIIDAAVPAEVEKGPGLSAALMPKITDLVDFEPMEKSSGSNALTELLGGGGSPSPAPQQQHQQLAPSPPTQTLAPPPALNISQAVPSWKDQLDWDSPEETIKVEEPQVTASSIVEPMASELRDPNRTTGGINLGHALPSWKDQLDWESPEESPEEKAASGGDSDKQEPADNSHEWPIDLTHSEQQAGTTDTVQTPPPQETVQTETHDDHRDETHDEGADEHEAPLPGDDWIDIDSSQQMETAANLQPITMDNLTLKQGKPHKKKDKKKNKGQS